MTNKELKVTWKLSKIFWQSGFILWILETVFFLIYEGWHLKATNPIEIFFDKCVSNLWHTALMLTIFTGLYLLVKLKK